MKTYRAAVVCDGGSNQSGPVVQQLADAELAGPSAISDHAAQRIGQRFRVALVGPRPGALLDRVATSPPAWTHATRRGQRARHAIGDADGKTQT